MDQVSLNQKLDFALQIAADAAELILEYYGADNIGLETKSDDSPVTLADRGAEELMRQAIAEKFPDDAILGEEFGETAGTSGYRWVLDPIDGTKSFVHAVPLFGTLIGVEYEGQSVIGVIHMPALGETAYAAKGEGAWFRRMSGAPKKMCVSTTSSLSEAMFSSTSATDFKAAGRSHLYENIVASSKVVRGWGDCYAHLLLARGDVDFVVEPTLNPWDCCAIIPIIEEAGGKATDFKGEVTAHGGNIVATNGALHEQVTALL
jgi:histidinol phosphatase-like enzyme (inositol monophosphatase family)